MAEAFCGARLRATGSATVIGIYGAAGKENVDLCAEASAASITISMRRKLSVTETTS